MAIQVISQGGGVPGPNSVGGAAIIDGEITGADIAANTIPSAKIFGSIDIVKGGTAATTALAARTNLATPGTADDNTYTGTQSFQDDVSISDTKVLSLGTSTITPLGDALNIDLEGTLGITSVSGQVNIQATISADDVFMQALDAAGAATLQSTLEVTGTTTLNDTLSVPTETSVFIGGATLDETDDVFTINASDGVSLANKNLAAVDDLNANTMSGNPEFSQGAVFADTARFDALIDAQNNLTVQGTTTIDGHLAQNGTATFDSTTNLNGNIFTGAPMVFNDTADFNTDVSLSGQTVNTQGTEFTGTAEFSGHLDLNTLTVAGMSTFDSGVALNTVTNTPEFTSSFTITGNQFAAIPDATDLASAISGLNTLLADLRSRGDLAT